jgi:hypothetical protein
MASGTIQALSTPLSGEQPFIGDLLEGELVVNTADGRAWVGDAIGSPIELGGAAKNKPIGISFSSNYIDVDLTNPLNLPISNSNPAVIPNGFYQEARFILRFPSNLSVLSTSTPYFDYSINWGLKSMWDPTSTSTSNNPIDHYKRANQVLVVELSSFGPSTEWMGRLIWAKLVKSPA